MRFYGRRVTALAPSPIPLPALDTPGRVRVRRALHAPPGFATTGPLRWRVSGSDVQICHPFDTATISDSAIIDSLEALVVAGVIGGQEQFEDAAVGIIRSVCRDERSAWAAFYANSISELRNGASSFSPVHRRARSLVRGTSVLEVGCCFGFLALQCAEDGHTVSACDISPGAIGLLTAAAQRRGVELDAVVGDATALPFADDSVDTVTLIHLLEHLDEDATTVAMTEALRVARKRVVVAVPFEEHPSEHFGHLLQLTEDELHDWAGRVAHAGARVFTDHGGWLILTPERTRSYT